MSILNHAPAIRLAATSGILLIMGIWELLAPKRKLRLAKGTRWRSNLLLIGVDSLAVRFLAPVAVILFAQQAQERHIGLLNQFALPFPLKVLLAIVALDFIIYLQHVMFHATPVLWRMHMVHHADGDIDVTTGLRFHPLEILISIGIKLAAVYLLGAPALAVLLFEVILNGCAMFNHGNVALPAGVDRLLRLVLVTPDMHRVHHSVIQNETNSNFGFNVPWWDRLCGTYQAQPSRGHQEMEIGLEDYRGPEPSGLGWILIAPFRRPPSRYSIHHG